MREVRLVLPMAPDMEIIASQAATSLAAFIGMSADRIDEVRMAVVEACINAFEHSRADERTVDVTLAVLGEREPDRLEVTVRDRGVGFTPSAVEEPRLAGRRSLWPGRASARAEWRHAE